MRMKLLAVSLLLVFSTAALAQGHVDVIEFKLDPGCSLEKHLAIVKDFNTQWGAQYGYKAEVLVPLQSHNLESLFWVGRSQNAAAFGRGWDSWRNELKDSNSVAAKLWARFQACSANISRRGYDVH